MIGRDFLSEMYPRGLSREYILDRREGLLSFEATTVLDIKNIWTKAGEESYPREYLEQEDLPCDYDSPISIRMVQRYRSCRRRPAQFYYQLDDVDQKTFTRFRLPTPGNDSEMKHQMVTFFAWISNMVDENDVMTLTENNETMLDIWKKRPITFFLQASSKVQCALLEEYNSRRLAFMADNNDAFTIILNQSSDEEGICPK